MSLEAISLVRSLPRLGVHLAPRDRFVLYALADYADDNFQAWPSHRTLTEWTGYARATVQEALDSLEEAKVITSEQRHRDDGGFTSKVYRINPPHAREPGTPAHPAGTPLPGSRADHVTQIGHPPAREPGTKTPQKEPPKNPHHQHRDEEDGSTVVSEALTAVERRRARNYSTGLLAQQHPEAHAALQDLQSVYAFKPAQYAIYAERFLEMARDHGGPMVAAAVEAVLMSGDRIKNPMTYLRKILTNHAAEVAREGPTGAAPDFKADLDSIFGAN